MGAKLIYLGDGKWVNPGLITTVSDKRTNGSGEVSILTVGGICFSAYCKNRNDEKTNKEADTALKSIGCIKPEAME